ncbi:MAG: hypothetical protein U1E27_13105 [Kiritimatiellia bacterium]|nr:hypothetical protein [Kiritimatiellia bacterium]
MKKNVKWLGALMIGATLSLSASAQDTYSANAVGFIKLELPPGLSLVSTPFVKVGGETPTIGDVFGTNVPDFSVVHVYHPSTGYRTFSFVFGEWYTGATGGQSTNQLDRGSGVWFKNPASSNVVLNVVGEVPGGAAFATEIVELPVGLSLVSFSFPASTPIAASGLVPDNFDVIHSYMPGEGYRSFSYVFGQWYEGATPVSFSFEPGKAYWYKSVSQKTWTQPKPYVWP